jgi:hypothetical protein
MPVFNVTPRVAQPRYPSGKSFAIRNADEGPYWWLGWGAKTGALLLPHVPAPALHQLLDAVEGEVLAHDAALRDFVPPRAPSPWWPLADEGADRRQGWLPDRAQEFDRRAWPRLQLQRQGGGNPRKISAEVNGSIMWPPERHTASTHQVL